MTKFEKRACLWIEKNLGLICIIAITIIRFEICFKFRKLVSDDFYCFLSGWFDEIKMRGGLPALKEQVGNYNMLYQFIICLFTYLPLKSIYCYKGLSIFFDFVLAVGSGALVCELKGNKSINLFAGIYSAVLILPITFLNSAAWGQCDSIYSAFIVLGLFYLVREKNVVAFIMFGIALAFKFQMIFILPFLLFYYMLEKKNSLLHWGLIPIVFYVLCLPAVIVRQDWLGPFKIYTQQAQEYPYMTTDFPTFWYLLGLDYGWLSIVSIWITLAILGLGLAYSIHKKIRLNSAKSFLQVAVWTTWTMVLFLPSMHERYSYLVEILILLLLFVDTRVLPVASVVIISALVRYQSFLFDKIPITRVHAIFYVCAWVAFSYMTFCEKRDVE